MLNYFLYLICFLASPNTALAVAQIDFTEPVKNNAMLIILGMGVFIVMAFGIGNFIYSKINAKLEKVKVFNRESEDKLHLAELKLKEQEIQRLRDDNSSLMGRTIALETKSNQCQAQLPMNYVSRAEYLSFVSEHKYDLNGIGVKVETAVKDVRTELKDDLETQIERIISILEAKLS